MKMQRKERRRYAGNLVESGSIVSERAKHRCGSVHRGIKRQREQIWRGVASSPAERLAKLTSISSASTHAPADARQDALFSGTL